MVYYIHLCNYISPSCAACIFYTYVWKNIRPCRYICVQILSEHVIGHAVPFGATVQIWSKIFLQCYAAVTLPFLHNKVKIYHKKYATGFSTYLLLVMRDGHMLVMVPPVRLFFRFVSGEKMGHRGLFKVLIWLCWHCVFLHYMYIYVYIHLYALVCLSMRTSVRQTAPVLIPWNSRACLTFNFFKGDKMAAGLKRPQLNWYVEMSRVIKLPKGRALPPPPLTVKITQHRVTCAYAFVCTYLHSQMRPPWSSEYKICRVKERKKKTTLGR